MEEKLPSWRWAIVSVVCLLCFMANYMQYQVSALAVEVMPMLNIDTVGFSMLFLVPMLTAVFFSIPLGALGDRIGSKKVVTVCTAISVAGGFLRCFTLDSFTMQMTSMFLIGHGNLGTQRQPHQGARHLISVNRLVSPWACSTRLRALPSLSLRSALACSAASLTLIWSLLSS